MTDTYQDELSMNLKRKRMSPAEEQLARQLESMGQEQPQQGAKPTPVMKPPQPDGPGFFKEAGRAVFGGLRDAVQNTINTVDDMATYADNHILDLRLGSKTFGQLGGALGSSGGSITNLVTGQPQGHQATLKDKLHLGEVAQNETTGGKLARGLVQFAVPFMGASKALGVASATTKVASVTRAMAAGAATDFTVFDPHEGRMSNLLTEWGKGNPILDNAVTQYLSASPEDGAIEGRFKNVLEGMGLGVMADGVLHGVKALKGRFLDKGIDPAKAVKEAAAQEAARSAAETGAVKEAAGEAASTPLQAQIEALTGVQRAPERAGRIAEQWQKRLDVQAATNGEPKLPTSEAPKYSVEDLNAGKTAEAQGLGGRSVQWDDATSSIILSADHHTVHPTHLPLEQRVLAAEAKAPHLRDANDLIVLRAYRQMQEAAFPGLIHGDAERALPGELITSLDAGSGKAAFTDAERAAMRDTPAAAQGVQPGDFVQHSGGQTDQVIKALPNGKVLVEDSATGAKRVVTPDTDPVSGLAQVSKQGGRANPQLMGHMAGSLLGAAAGYTSAEDDATLADRLSLAGMGALAGLGVSVKVGSKLGGFHKVLTEGEKAAIANPHPVVQDLARPEVRGIAPKAPGIKTPPVIARSKVESFARDYVKAVQDGTTADLVKTLDESHFNFDHMDSPEDVKGLIDAVSAAFEKETAHATGGVQTFKETAALATDLGLRTETLKSLYGDTGNLAARVYAARTVMAASASKVTNLAKLAATEGGASDLIAFRKQVAVHAALQAQMKGVQTEVARALGQFRMQAQTIDLAIHEKNAVLDALGGRAANQRFAELLDGISNPADLHAVARRGADARSSGALWWAWMQGLLSGPATHAANLLGNSAVAVISPVERALAGMISQIPHIGSGELHASEALDQMAGMVGGMVDALHISTKGFKALPEAAGQALTGDFRGAGQTLEKNASEFGTAWQSFGADRPITGDGLGGTIENASRPISSTSFNLDPHTLLGKVADGLGAVVGGPGRALQASDELFRTMHYRGELRSLASREGRQHGLQGDDLAKYVQDILDEPPQHLHEKAFEAAREGTFTAPLGEAGRSIQDMLFKVPGMRWVVPFVRTPVNILKYSGRRIPGLNILSEQIRGDFMAGGARRDQAIAKTVMGGMAMTIAGLAASSGLITGGGEPNKTAETLGGWQPYSIKVGDKFISYQRIEPFATLFGLAADGIDIAGHVSQKDSQDLSASIFSAISNDILSKTFVKGLAGFAAALVDPKKAETWMEQFSGSVVPSIANTVRRMDDNTIKDVRNFTDSIKARLPGYSKDVPAKVDLFGRDVTYKAGWGPDLASPMSLTMTSDDPAARELMRLNLDLKQPGRTIQGPAGAKGIDLNPQQYRRLLQLAGNEVKIGDQGFHDALKELVQSEDYKALPEQEDLFGYRQAKHQAIANLQTRYNRAAKQQLLREDADLAALLHQHKENARAALRGDEVLPLNN